MSQRSEVFCDSQDIIASYYWLIPKFMQVGRPLEELTLGKNASKKKAAIQWDDRCQQAFNA